jgi:hypothetical protein
MESGSSGSVASVLLERVASVALDRVASVALGRVVGGGRL